MNQSIYAGECWHCHKYVRAGLSLSAEGIVPPPMIVAACGCTQPPTTLRLIYEGAHADAKGISGRDVLRAS